MSSPSLYRRILGTRFDALPDVLRRFHDTPGGGRASGTLQVERARGRLRNGLASLSGLPAAGSELPVCLEVKVQGDRERWVRQIAGHQLETFQWARGNLLMESFGPTVFSTALAIEGSCLRYEFQRAWFAGILLPRRLAPFVDSHVTAGESGWRVSVRIDAPFLGELVQYEGWVELE